MYRVQRQTRPSQEGTKGPLTEKQICWLDSCQAAQYKNSLQGTKKFKPGSAGSKVTSRPTIYFVFLSPSLVPTISVAVRDLDFLRKRPSKGKGRRLFIHENLAFVHDMTSTSKFELCQLYSIHVSLHFPSFKNFPALFENCLCFHNFLCKVSTLYKKSMK